MSFWWFRSKLRKYLERSTFLSKSLKHLNCERTKISGSFFHRRTKEHIPPYLTIDLHLYFLCVLKREKRNETKGGEFVPKFSFRFVVAVQNEWRKFVLYVAFQMTDRHFYFMEHKQGKTADLNLIERRPKLIWPLSFTPLSFEVDEIWRFFSGCHELEGWKQNLRRQMRNDLFCTRLKLSLSWSQAGRQAASLDSHNGRSIQLLQDTKRECDPLVLIYGDHNFDSFYFWIVNIPPPPVFPGRRRFPQQL